MYFVNVCTDQIRSIWFEKKKKDLNTGFYFPKQNVLDSRKTDFMAVVIMRIGLIMTYSADHRREGFCKQAKSNMRLLNVLLYNGCPFCRLKLIIMEILYSTKTCDFSWHGNIFKYILCLF